MERKSRIIAFLGNAWPFLLCAIVGFAIFEPVRLASIAQLAPDSMPYFRVPFGMRQVEDVLANGGSAPLSLLYWLAFPPLVAHELTYLVDSLLVAIAGALYLRGRRVRPVLAWLGGAALGFSGYSFTLVSAGHRGYFHMMACTLFAFPLLAKIARDTRPISRRWTSYALLGFALGWGILTQPDVFALVAALAVAYLLWLTFRRSAVDGLEDETAPRRMLRVWPAFAISLLAFLLAGGGIFHALVYRFIPDRLAQIRRDSAAIAAQTGTDPEKTGPVPVSEYDKQSLTDAEKAEAEAKTKHENWIFATNWSLPPEDALEFVAPCVRGIETQNLLSRDYPYWGRLGRTDGWEQHHQGFPNFRQHTVYLGAIQVFFALLAICAWFRSRRRGGAVDPWLRDVPFWAVAGIIAMLLSFGRYTPLYRAFYAIPGMNLLRAPVKLHHLTEICTALLFGIGLAAAFQTGTGPVAADEKSGTDPEKARGKKGTDSKKTGPVPVLCLALVPGIALVIASMVVKGGPAGLIANWKMLGYADGVAQMFLPRMAGALLHGGLLWIAGVASWFIGRRGGVARAAAMALVWALVGGDLIAVSRNYINPYDVMGIYGRSELTNTILRDDSVPMPQVANLITNPTDPNDQLTLSCEMKRIEVNVRSSLQRPVAIKMMKRMGAYLNLSRVDYVFAPESALKQLPLAGFELVKRIDAGAMLGANRALPAVLLKRKNPQPFAEWFPTWSNVPADGQVDAALRPGWDSLGDPLIDAPAPEGEALESAKAAAASARVEVESMRFAREPTMDSVIRTHSDAPGMLGVRQYFELPAEALVDGAPAPVHHYNALWTAVPVPAGDHVVTVRRVRGAGFPLQLGAVALAAFLATLAIHAITNASRRENAA